MQVIQLHRCKVSNVPQIHFCFLHLCSSLCTFVCSLENKDKNTISAHMRSNDILGFFVLFFRPYISNQDELFAWLWTERASSGQNSTTTKMFTFYRERLVAVLTRRYFSVPAESLQAIYMVLFTEYLHGTCCECLWYFLVHTYVVPTGHLYCTHWIFTKYLLRVVLMCLLWYKLSTLNLLLCLLYFS